MVTISILAFVLLGVNSLEIQTDEVDGQQYLSSRLDQLKHLLREQDAKLTRQETLLHQQNDLIGQLKAEDTRQDNLIRHQDNLIRPLITKQFHQETPQPQRKDKPSYRPQLPPYGGGQRRHGISPSHDVTTRSDDWGSLEAVVSHVSQKVTELEADIQALQTQTTTDIQMLKTNVNRQALDIQDARSSTFIQWGSSTCGAHSQLVYSGIVGGSWYDHSGAATNYLCLTMSPVLSSITNDSYPGYLYGGEYQTYDSHMDKDPVCAVCRSTFTTTVMIPGTNVCTPGWHLQYSGYLMSGHYGNAAGSEYICVDSKLESFVGSDRNDNGVLLHFVRTRCGSLPCSPYVNDRVVTCAVCSK